MSESKNYDRVSLEKKLRDELYHSCEVCIEELNYRPTYFLNMLEDGAVSASQSVICSKSIPEGFSFLYELGRLDLTVEHIVLTGEWKVLFDSAVLQKARKRLKDLNYTFKEWKSDSKD